MKQLEDTADYYYRHPERYGFSQEVEELSSHLGLEEMRAVGTIGTNVEVVTDYVITRPFSNIRNKRIPHLKGVGETIVHRLIFLDGKGHDHKSIYAKMFVGKRGAGNDDSIPVFIEKTFYPTEKFNFLTYDSDYRQPLLYGSRLDINAIQKFHLEAFKGDNFNQYMREIAGKPFWEFTGVSRKPTGDISFTHTGIYFVSSYVFCYLFKTSLRLHHKDHHIIKLKQ